MTEKERRRALYMQDKKAYKKERERFVRGVSKTFRTIAENKRDEMLYLEEQTKEAIEDEKE